MTRYTRPHFASSALITIDTQNDTLDGQPFEIPGTSAVLPKMRELLDIYRGAHLPIVHIVRIYDPDGSNVDVCRRQAVEDGAPLVLRDSPGAELAPPLFGGAPATLDSRTLLAGGIQSVGPHEVIIYKPRWGAFYRTPLEDHLQRLGADTLVFTGCNFPNCPRTSVYEASERDFRLVLVADALSGLYDRGVRELENIGVSVLAADAVAAAVRALPG